MRRRRYWGRVSTFFVITCLLLASGASLWLAHDQAVAFVHPVRKIVAQAGNTIEFEEVTFESADGLELSGWFAPPAAADSDATVIFVHGFGGNRSDLRAFATPLIERGYGALLFDLRNHGESEEAATTLGYKEVEDVRGAVAYLRSRPEVGDAPLGLVGHSMGAATVLRAGARTPDVAFVVAISGYTSLEDNVAEGVTAMTGLPSFPFAPLIVWFGEQEAGADLSDVRPIDDLADIAPRPVMFIHGERDQLVNPRNSERLYEAAAEPKTLYIIPEAGHATFLYEVPEELQRRFVAFVEAALASE